MSNQDSIVVFGGSGFLGSHLADTLSEAGYRVTIFDQVESQWLRADQRMVIGDILDDDAVSKAIKGARFVYHLAGVADLGQAAAKPRQTIISNVLGSTNIIEACVEHDVERLMFASTVYVYSDKGSFYRVSKQSTELLIEAYRQQYGLNYTILRYGSLYGPRAQDWNGLKQFVVQAVHNNRIVYPGTGRERREYIHVHDAARLSLQALENDFRNECLTLTGAQIMTSQEMLEIIREVSGKDIEIEFKVTQDDYQTFHYGLTPYRYTPKKGRKIMPSVYIDIGEGILNLIDEVSQQDEKDGPDELTEPEPPGTRGV